MTTLVFLLEEPSTKEMLKGVLPRLLPPAITVRYVAFEGKQDMRNQLERKLRGWLSPNTRFVIVRDQDSGDCRAIKSEIVKSCKRAGRRDVLIRIACRELESFYLGDLAAVEQGLGLTALARHQAGRKYRLPDALNNAKQELTKLTNGRYQPLAGSRAIAPFLRLDAGNRSHSFNTLLTGTRRVANELLLVT